MTRHTGIPSFPHFLRTPRAPLDVQRSGITAEWREEEDAEM
ncbi:hypothetical protein E2C01_076331 [Portunus trituberculatus]|uniref:Uncharacterized protein n=1 Tax=Portunus trituberculatus TaxID=210409 RepID=A0A5B7IB60_PORTR|nr:hypothetical protein [Portunus trituberculatus]